MNLRAHKTSRFFGHEECISDVSASVSTPFRAKATVTFKDHGKAIQMTTKYARSTLDCR